jgi:hypothetical protein
MVLLFAPLPTAAAAFLGWAVMRFRRASAASRDGRALEVAALEVGELVGLGLAGGLSTAGAHAAALDFCADRIRDPVRDLVATMRRRGVVTALTTVRGPLAGGAAVLASATASGAPVLPALDAHLRQEHHRRHMERVEAARRLPIRLLLPLTLLVLPGFVLITVGPAVIDSLARISP